jgi:hypothetical protein
VNSYEFYLFPLVELPPLDPVPVPRLPSPPGFLPPVVPVPAPGLLAALPLPMLSVPPPITFPEPLPPLFSLTLLKPLSPVDPPRVLPCGGVELLDPLAAPLPELPLPLLPKLLSVPCVDSLLMLPLPVSLPEPLCAYARPSSLSDLKNRSEKVTG